MKKFILFCAVLWCVPQVLAQTNGPVRLALIAGSSEASAASDVLTVELSKNTKLQLLERNEIEKVYREQGLSAANKDYLKLGRILGADGLLLFEVVRTKRETNLTTRLIAVKPGVVLTEGSFAWPLKETQSWAESVAARLRLFSPKLAVLVKEAIPISVVNLRSAVQSAEGAETERQLKLLFIQRLSQEPRFFVLERQQMQLLSEEKELKADESVFWNGSYLLEGVIDQNGYSADRITINARLTPPRGGAPLLMEASGGRTNVSAVVDRLTVKVSEALGITHATQEWSAADEAEQYLSEAKWALKWKVYGEAQAASESAWALGRRDQDCAVMRVKSYAGMVPSDVGHYETLTAGYPTNYAGTQAELTRILRQHGSGIEYEERRWGDTREFSFAYSDEQPDPKLLESVRRALQLYLDFSRSLPAGEPKAGSVWYRLGVETLDAASLVLQHFYFVKDSQKSSAEELAGLRKLSRLVAEWISKSPSVRETYYVGDRIATHDEFVRTIESAPNIFRCAVEWGGYWQERPEDAVGLYRRLMSSPVFCYVHRFFWIRELNKPRLVAWSDQDRSRIPAVWNDFLGELRGSTNVLLRMEADALAVADARIDGEKEAAFHALFEEIFANAGVLVGNNVEVLYLDWGTGSLVSGGGIVTPTKEKLEHQYYSEYRPRIEAMDREYWNNTVIAGNASSAFEKQKQFLKEDRPYVFLEFVQTFESRQYSRAQALELKPLLATYKSNLVAQVESLPVSQRGRLQGGVAQVGFVENAVDRILNPPAPARPQTSTARVTNPATATPVVRAPQPPRREADSETATNILFVRQFLEIPWDRFRSNQAEEQLSQFTIAGHISYAGKLWLDLRYHEHYVSYFENGSRWVDLDYAVMAAWNPEKGTWETIPYPTATTSDRWAPAEFGAIDGEALYVSGTGYLRRYDFKTARWESLSVPWQKPTRLFAVANRLFAANDEAIFEILDGGRSIKILASCRRRPTASALDSLDSLGQPELFEGPDRSVRVSVAKKVFTWDSGDWREVFSLEFSQPPEICEDGVVFRSQPYGGPVSLWVLSKHQTAPELCLYEKSRPDPNRPFMQVRPRTEPPPAPLWHSPKGDLLGSTASAAVLHSNVFFFTEHATVTNVSGSSMAAERNGYHAKLVCFSRDCPEAIVIPLRFDADRARPPLKGLVGKSMSAPWNVAPAWLHFTDRFLFIGQPDATGVWAIPMPELDRAIAEQKQRLLAQFAAIKIAGEQRRKQWLARYDRNHNGTVDADEKEAALGDEAFVEGKIEEIDANHNGILDAAELAWFDANTNGVLETNEEAAIVLAQKVLTKKAFTTFDANNDGVLDSSELSDFIGPSGPSAGGAYGFSPGMPGRSGNFDLQAFQALLEQRTRGQLMSGRRGPAFPPSGPGPARAGAQASLKDAVENYWSRAGSGRNSSTSEPPPTRSLSDPVGAPR